MWLRSGLPQSTSKTYNLSTLLRFALIVPPAYTIQPFRAITLSHEQRHYTVRPVIVTVLAYVYIRRNANSYNLFVEFSSTPLIPSKGNMLNILFAAVAFNMHKLKKNYDLSRGLKKPFSTSTNDIPIPLFKRQSISKNLFQRPNTVSFIDLYHAFYPQPELW